MRLVIFGPPGSGKSTIAKLIAKRFRLKHIVASDIIKREIKKNNFIGKKMNEFIEKGELVPENLIENLMKINLPKNSFISDGYPRRTSQAKVLDKLSMPDSVVFLNVPYSVLIKRLLNRAKIEGRKDDTPKTIKERFNVYRKQTEPLLNYYKNKLIIINANRDIKVIEKDVIKRLKNANSGSKTKS